MADRRWTLPRVGFGALISLSLTAGAVVPEAGATAVAPNAALQPVPFMVATAPGDGAGAMEPLGDVGFLREIDVLAGHLRVGRELVDAGRFDEALPHFLHPLEEILPALAGDLIERDVAPFADALVVAAGLVDDGTAAGVDEQVATVLAVLDDARAAILRASDGQRRLTIETAIAVLRTAADEYDEAIADGAVVNLIEYQDGRGFVAVARDRLSAIMPELRQADASRAAAVEDALAQIAAVFPDIAPPTPLAVLPADLFALVSMVELYLSAY